MGFFSLGGGEDAGRLAHRLKVVEQKLDMIFQHLGIDYHEEPKSPMEQQIVDLVHSGRKIAAIKLYREQTGAGLKEAKDAVEEIAG